jgi:protein arginine N-methyltransferase 1
MSFDNVYVRSIAPADLLAQPDAARRWDALDFAGAPDGRRRGGAAWTLAAPATVYGFALWWRCELVPGVWLGTGPGEPPTHWEQVYAPVAQPIAGAIGDELALELESETGGGEAGIGMRWRATHRRGGAVLSEQLQDIGRGFIG